MSNTSKVTGTLVVASRPKIGTFQHSSNGCMSKTVWYTQLRFGMIPYRPNLLTKFHSNQKWSVSFMMIWHGITYFPHSLCFILACFLADSVADFLPLSSLFSCLVISLSLCNLFAYILSCLFLIVLEICWLAFLVF